MNYNNEHLKEIVSTSNSYSEVAKKLGLKNFYGNRQTIKKHIIEQGLSTSHFGAYNFKKCGRKKIDLKDILTVNSNYDIRQLKIRLVNEKLLEYKCSGDGCKCNGEWLGKPITLQLDHINGVNDDNRLENLRFLCPNCHSQTPTFGGKNSKIKPNKKTLICECGLKISNKAKQCRDCSNKKQRKIERPTLDVLLNEISDLGYSATGRKYGVSDNAIRKWCKIDNKR